FIGVHHVENTHRTNLDQATGKTRFLHEREHVHRVVIFSQGAGDKTVITRIMHRRIQGAVQPEHTELSVIFVLVGRVLGDLDNHAHQFRRFWAGLNVVQRWIHLFSVAKRREGGKTWTVHNRPKAALTAMIVP